MRSALSLLMVITCARASSTLHNLRENLIPPDGTAWRGSVIGNKSDTEVAEYTKRTGFPLHVLRVFSKYPITQEMREFIKNGGILWYNMAPSNWQQTVDQVKNKKSKLVDDLIDMLQSIAPHKAYVCLYHEPDHDIDPSEGRTADAYRAMWAAVHAAVKSAGVTNAVWVMDYSVGVGRGDGVMWQPALELWPGTDYVDWLFFNIFERKKDASQGEDYAAIANKIYSKFSEAQDSDCPAAPCNFGKIPWGIGAFGTHSMSFGRGGGAVPFTQQVEFLNQAYDGASTFPLLRAYLYYDDKACAITPELLPSYKHFLSSPIFTSDDSEEILFA